MTVLQKRRKAAIDFLEREAAEWEKQAEKELCDKAKREVGKVRGILIAECLRTLKLLKRVSS